jgi:hypothetical protein
MSVFTEGHRDAEIPREEKKEVIKDVQIAIGL